ncbi:uncharacterized protein LTR77_004889 [Saxophila tyrrhenica]|uniref:Uncharacterized protein n=1 Tax=Saxophila tyrrhenica TaxID=1690608 RepID=A0AAV9PDT4_9PEZI|nr:hypothetical protein LTR77_004889 [Saxophila tyrrhenica]
MSPSATAACEQRAMAFRRPTSVCLFSGSGSDGFFSDNGKLGDERHEASELTSGIKPDPLGNDENEWPSNDAGTDTLSFEALSKFKDMRRAILSRLRNPWPTTTQIMPHNYHTRKSDIAFLADLSLPEANAALIPHPKFRSLILNEGLHEKNLRRVIRVQLLRCQCPRNIYRVLAVCMQSKAAAQALSILFEPLIRALYRSRNTVSDPQVLATLNVIIARFKLANLYVSPYFLFLGLRFAARTRSLTSMQRYLRHIRQANLTMPANVFRSVIAKFSIGSRGLGEIRNGRWRRSDLLQVLKGFDDCSHLPPAQKYHLGSFLDRSDWQFLHGWVAVLARCRDSEGVWREWEHWKQSSARLDPRKLGKGGRGMSSRWRGDYWFVEQMTHSGDLRLAWRVVEESGLDFSTVKGKVKFRLLDGIEFATTRSWEGGAREAMVEKYDVELRKIERALGLRWVADGMADDGEGVHELVRDQWEVMEELGAEDWKFEEDYGYPIDAEYLVPETEERALHQAEERGRVEQDEGG